MSDYYFPSTHPTARKQHTCVLCGRTIERGEAYRRQVYVYDGRKGETKCCAQCEAFAKALYAAGFEGEGGGWFYLPELDASEVAYCGFSLEHRRYRDRWRNDEGELVMPSTLLEYAHESPGLGAGS